MNHYLYKRPSQKLSKQLQILTDMQQINLASLSSGYTADSHCGIADLLHSYLTHHNWTWNFHQQQKKCLIVTLLP